MAQAKKTTTLLKSILADTYALYLKTQNYHWNVTGAHFFSLHLLFEKQYEELAEAADTLAERIRALGEMAPGSFKEFISLMTQSEARSGIGASGMIEDLMKSHEALRQSIYAILDQVREDEVTLNLLVDRLTDHEKTIWMLKSHQ